MTGRLLVSGLIAIVLALGPTRASLAGDGRPTVVLDRLTFPERLGAKRYRRYLTGVLHREARSLQWGASADSRIEYRFFVHELKVSTSDNLLRVKVVAEGVLPSGKHAKSQLTFGGSPGHHHQLIEQVLAIVARGVMARLAEMERVRRGHLPDADLPAPS